MRQTVHASHLYCFFINDPSTSHIYTLSLHDALPIYSLSLRLSPHASGNAIRSIALSPPTQTPRHRSVSPATCPGTRSEEHTSELQSQSNLVCRLLLEKKKKNTKLNLLILTHNILTTI